MKDNLSDSFRETFYAMSDHGHLLYEQLCEYFGSILHISGGPIGQAPSFDIGVDIIKSDQTRADEAGTGVRIKLDDTSLPFKDHSYEYWTKTTTKGNYSIKLRKKIGSSEIEEIWNGDEE